MPEESWREIPDSPGCYASDQGRVQIPGVNNGLPTVGYRNGWGYLLVVITGKSRSVHSLIMLTFHGPPPLGYEINHIDSVKHHNKLENLEYVTGSQNILHAVKSGRFPIGEKRWNATYTDKIVTRIWELRRDGLRPAQIAFQLSLTTSGVYKITHGENWKHLRPSDWEALQT